MAVPKKKTSKSKRNMRRGSNGTYSYNFPNVGVDSEGNHALSHQVSPEGFYKGRKVVADKVKADAEAA